MTKVRTLRVDKRLHKYLLVGAINTVFGYAIFAFFIYIGMHYSIAIFFATIFGILFNFKTYGKLVFGEHTWSLLTKFILVYIVIYIAHVSLMTLFNSLTVNLYAGGVMALFPVAYLGYILNSRYVWKEK